MHPIFIFDKISKSVIFLSLIIMHIVLRNYVHIIIIMCILLFNNITKMWKDAWHVSIIIIENCVGH